MWSNKISQHFKMVLFAALALATKAREEGGPDHLLLAVSYQNGPLWRAVLRDLKIDALAFRSHIESYIDAHSQAQLAPPGVGGQMSHALTAVLGAALLLGKSRNITAELNVGTLLLALANEASLVAEILTLFGVSTSSFRVAVERNLEHEKDER